MCTPEAVCEYFYCNAISYEPVNVICLILCSIFFTLSMISSIKFLRVIYNIRNNKNSTTSNNNNNNKQELSKFFLYTSLLTHTFFDLTNICILIMQITCGLNQPFITLMILMPLAGCLYFAGYTTLFVIFVGRLYFSFYRTTYAFKKKTYGCLCFIGALAWSFNIVGAVDYIRDFQFKPSFAISGSLYVLTSLTIFFLFCMSLYHLTISRRQTIALKREQKIDTSSLDVNQMRLINLITKYTLLVFFSHFVIIPVLMVMIMRMQMPRERIHQHEVLYHVHLTLMSLDTVVNLICLDLSFGFNTKDYNKLFNCCHTFVQARIANFALQHMYGDRVSSVDPNPIESSAKPSEKDQIELQTQLNQSSPTITATTTNTSTNTNTNTNTNTTI